MLLTVNGDPIKYALAPEQMQHGLKMYLEHGIEPGSFLTAVLKNDLMRAMGQPDHIMQYRIFELCSWLYNYAPGGSYGSERNFQNWITERRKADREAS